LRKKKGINSFFTKKNKGSATKEIKKIAILISFVGEQVKNPTKCKDKPGGGFVK